mmetsp:Transcript_4697/g.12271  ORF Transcript_4697/g.12271 Transcript_4697/m.12271 type:complete len:207 (-) Transcript_4697:37-657(-)
MRSMARSRRCGLKQEGGSSPSSFEIPHVRFIHQRKRIPPKNANTPSRRMEHRIFRIRLVHIFSCVIFCVRMLVHPPIITLLQGYIITSAHPHQKCNLNAMESASLTLNDALLAERRLPLRHDLLMYILNLDSPKLGTQDRHVPLHNRDGARRPKVNGDLKDVVAHVEDGDGLIVERQMLRWASETIGRHALAGRDRPEPGNGAASQ